MYTDENGNKYWGTKPSCATCTKHSKWSFCSLGMTKTSPTMRNMDGTDTGWYCLRYVSNTGKA